MKKEVKDIRSKRSYLRLSKLIKERSSNKCFYCGKELKPEEKTIDHKLPLSKGGKHRRENIVISCEACNCLKADMTVSEFIEFRKSYIPKEKPNYIDGYLHIDEIHIPLAFMRTPPKQEKVDKAIKYYNDCGEYNNPIIIMSKRNKVLTDGYSRYIASQILGVDVLPVKFQSN